MVGSGNPIKRNRDQVLEALRRGSFRESSGEAQEPTGEQAPEFEPEGRPGPIGDGSPFPAQDRIGDVIGRSEWEELVEEHYYLLMGQVGQRYPAFAPEGKEDKITVLSRLWGKVLEKHAGHRAAEYFFEIAALSYTASFVGGMYLEHQARQAGAGASRSSSTTNSKPSNDEEESNQRNHAESKADRSARYPNLKD